MNCGNLRRERAGQFVLGDLNPGDLAVIPYAALAEAEAAQGFFSLFDGRKSLQRHRTAILNAG